MRKIFIWILLAYLLLSVFMITTVAQDELSIRMRIKNEVEIRQVTSIVVGIINNREEQVFSYGVMSKDNYKTPDRNTLYEIGSITKVFTSLLLANMVDRGELSLNDPISKFLPESVKTPTRNGREITLLDLATHRSGLPRMSNNLEPKDLNNPLADYTVARMYDFLSNYTLPRDIGERFEYSNYGVGLLGHILALKAGVDYETLVRSRICEPLKMTSTVIMLSPELQSRLAKGYNNKGTPVDNWDMPTLAGAGALRSSVNDLLIFLAANLGLTKTELASSIQQTHQIKATTDISGCNIGLGWLILKNGDSQIIWHNGETGGYHTFIGFDKKRERGVVVLSNSTNRSIDDLGFYILECKF